MTGPFFFLRPSVHVLASYQRQVHITNILAFIFCWVALGIFFIFYYLFGWMNALQYILVVSALFLFITPINRVSIHVGRMLFCLIPVWLTFFVTIYFKLEGAVRTDIVYFDSRFILMASVILPGIVFRLEERVSLLVCMGSAFICLIFYDPIHQLFGAGYFQKGFSDPSYYYINYIVTITFLVLVFGIVLLRSVLEKSEKNLVNQNRELQTKQHEIEAQHEELMQQREELTTSTEKLEQANRLILQQQDALHKYNAHLLATVDEKSRQLMQTNEELVKYNNELLQFSYTVSHNLRGPVARLLGLSHLVKVTESESEKKHMENLIESSTLELDNVLRDLSMIIDIRNELYRVRERISLQQEWEKALALLADFTKPIDDLRVDFSAAPYVFGIRPMVQSIFYNLVSNAIKYRSREHPLQIIVKTIAHSNSKTQLEITDNGVGIDLVHHGESVFKLYKRFHPEISGKGLGLYLVKTQVEAMGGEIGVASELGKGTTFTVVFTQPEQIGKQVFHESSTAEVYYDANLRVTVLVWKKNTSSAEYRETLMIALNSSKIYNTKAWIVDLRRREAVSEDDQQWFFGSIAPEIGNSNVKHVALIKPPGFEMTSYYEKLDRLTASLGLRLTLHDSVEEALGAMEDF